MPSPRFQKGRANPMWKGGRTVDPRGYVLVRVGTDHPLADVRGYAYEHRLKAWKAGKLKLDGIRRHVHHEDEKRGNNALDNLEPLTPWAHRAKHRKKDRGLRNPGEPNPLIVCACGCTKRFRKFDRCGRPRIYVSGHNPMEAPTMRAVLAALGARPRSRRYITKLAGRPKPATTVCLSKLKRAGLARNVGAGQWIITERGRKWLL